VFLCIHLADYGQIDPNKLDSLSRSIDSSAKAYKQQQSAIIKVQESTYRSKAKALQQNARPANDSIAEQRRKESQPHTIRIVIGVLLLLVPIFIILRKKKPTP
jgi:hypothetical protein